MTSATPAQPAFRRQLGLLDFTLLVIGAIIGDGIFVVTAMGAQSLGPAQIVAWLAGGVLAGFIALAFVQCAAIDPEVGGSYSYASRAFGPFIGFLTGWTLYAGEWVALAAFPQAFFNYFHYLTGAPTSLEVPVKLGLIGLVTAVNLAGVRQGARTNDFLAAAKLVPLVLLALLGLAFLVLRGDVASSNLRPFAPLGWSDFGGALLPVFWAYAGFELAVLPAGEVRAPQRTLPRGLFIGVAVSMVLYILVSLTVVIALPWQEVAASSHPLATAMSAIIGSFGGPADLGGRIIGLGALLSIAGVFVVFTLALARLSFALARDGVFPGAFARLHSRYQTPFIGLAFQAISAVVLSTVFDLRSLLSTAVLLLSLCYLATSLSAISLVRRNPGLALHLPGVRVLLGLAVLSSAFLTFQASPAQALVCVAVALAGAGLYRLRRPLAAVDGDRLQPPEHHPHGWLHRSVARRRL